MAADHARCSRCKSLYLISLPTAKGKEPRVGECPDPLCHAVAHYTDEEWAGKASMARARVAAGIEITEFDREALRRCS